VTTILEPLAAIRELTKWEVADRLYHGSAFDYDAPPGFVAHLSRQMDHGDVRAGLVWLYPQGSDQHRLVGLPAPLCREVQATLRQRRIVHWTPDGAWVPNA